MSYFHKYINKPIRNRFRKWLGIDVISETLQFQSNEISWQVNTIKEMQEILKERTEYHVDVHHYAKQGSRVILIGQFQKRDFIKCYYINDVEFKHLINHLREINITAQQGRIDAMPYFSTVINNELDKDRRPNFD